MTSVRSPVSTLNTYLPSHMPTITHDTFVQAVLDDFATVYARSHGTFQPIQVDKSSMTPEQRAKVETGMQELKSWEWTFGQTPEFSNEIEGDLSFGSVVSPAICFTLCTGL